MLLVEDLLLEILDDDLVGPFATEKALLPEGTFVGKAGIQPFPREGAERGRLNEIGYALLPAYWGRGYATEAARAIVAWYFQMTNHEVLSAFTEPENVVSGNVLRKAGLRFVEVRDVGLAKPHSVFEINRSLA